MTSDVSLEATDTLAPSTDSAPETAVESAGTAAREPPQSNTKRKATYYVRRDAIKSLKDQVKALEQELARARSTSAATLRKLRRLSLLYEQSIERNHFAVAGTESTLSAYKLAMGFTTAIPLKTYIHMPADPRSRQELLESLWRPKLDAALRFMTERARFLDLRNEHKSEESFKLPSGDMVFEGCEVTTFTGGHSVNQVFHPLASFIVSQEISISERLGVLTVRESDDADGINSAIFAANVAANAAETKPAYAVAAMDFVDVDDLYSYCPDTLARKEMTAALTITEITSETGARVVSLCRWAYVRLRMPLCGLSEEEAASVRDSVTGFTAVMDKVMREHLTTELPLP